MIIWLSLASNGHFEQPFCYLDKSESNCFLIMSLFLNMLSNLDPDKYNQFAIKVDEVIASVLPGVRARKNRSQNESDEETEDKKEEAVV